MGGLTRNCARGLQFTFVRYIVCNCRMAPATTHNPKTLKTGPQKHAEHFCIHFSQAPVQGVMAPLHSTGKLLISTLYRQFRTCLDCHEDHTISVTTRGVGDGLHHSSCIMQCACFRRVLILGYSRHSSRARYCHQCLVGVACFILSPSTFREPHTHVIRMCYMPHSVWGYRSSRLPGAGSSARCAPCSPQPGRPP